MPAVIGGALFDQYQEWFVRIGVFSVTVVAVYLAGRYLVLPPVSRVVSGRNPRNATLVNAIEQYLKVVFVVAAVPVATAAAGFGGVAAGSTLVVAAATLALGVAGQDVIGNLVSGVFLVLDPDFNVRDYIEWDDQAGTIERIDLRVTRVRTPADEVLTVPNTHLATNAVRNPFTRGRYRISERVFVSYGDDLEHARRAVLAEMRADDRIAEDPEPVVHVTDLGPNAVELAVRVWVENPRRSDVVTLDSDVAAHVKDALQEADVTVAPPSQHAVTGDITVSDDGREAEP